MYQNVLVMILAGGEGSRLQPLTRDRAKPSVPFGGRYRLIDFVLSNFVNSGFTKIKVLTQYKSNSLNTHLTRAWRLARILDQYIEAVPAQQNVGKKWYEGSADAIYQNLNIITDEEPDYVCIFGADHIYKMDIGQMLQFHIETGADLTVAAKPVTLEEARSFGVIAVDETWRMVDFSEKPEEPRSMPTDPTRALASMGNYIFSTDALIREIRRDAELDESLHDFGRDIITSMYGDYKVQVYDFQTNRIPNQKEREKGFWMDVGTIGAYYHASMDLVGTDPVFDLYNRRWPIRTHYEHNPPAKFVHSSGDRVGIATRSTVADGCIISGGQIDNSILFPRVRVHSYSHIQDSILFEGVEVGRYAQIRRAIIDKNVKIPPHCQIGYNLEADRARFTVTDDDITVVAKDMKIEG